MPSPRRRSDDTTSARRFIARRASSAGASARDACTSGRRKVRIPSSTICPSGLRGVFSAMSSTSWWVAEAIRCDRRSAKPRARLRDRWSSTSRSTTT
jgi:hypothetical protein